MKISKFVNNPNDKPFHTSGFAQAANGDSMGATSAESFNRRRRIDQNRQAVRKYRESHMGRPIMPGRVHARIDVVNPVRSTTPKAPSRQQQNAQNSSVNLIDGQPNVPPPSRRMLFKEPTKPNFNPFQ